MRKESWFRGPLLSVLLVMVTSAAVAQGGEANDGEEECGGLCEEITVTGENWGHNPNDTGWHWEGFPNAHNPAPPPYQPYNGPETEPQGDQSLSADDWAAIDALFADFCTAISKGEDAAKIVAALRSLAKRHPAAWVIVTATLEGLGATCRLSGHG